MEMETGRYEVTKKSGERGKLAEPFKPPKKGNWTQPSERKEKRNERRKRVLLQQVETLAAGPLRTSSDRSCPDARDRTPSIIKSSRVGL